MQQRIFQYTDRLDRLLYAIAAIGAIVSGAALPLMTLVFGASTRTFSNFSRNDTDPAAFQNEVNGLVLYFVYLFVGRFVINYIGKDNYAELAMGPGRGAKPFAGTLCVCLAATRTTNALRRAFLDSLVRKEIGHFDTADSGSTAAQVTTSKKRLSGSHKKCKADSLPNRWQSRQPGHCGKALHVCQRYRSVLLRLHRCAGRPMEACSYYHERHPGHCALCRSSHQI